MNWSLDLGMMTNHRLPESTGQSSELSESTEHSSKPVTPNTYSIYYQGTKEITNQVTTWINNGTSVLPKPRP
jgi:hypothetical protein